MKQKFITRDPRKRTAFKVSARILKSGKCRVRMVKSNRYLTAFLFDEKNILLGQVSSSSFSQDKFSCKNKPASLELADKIKEICKSRNVTDIAFDRYRYKYHGVVASFADRLREHKLIK
jgi:large subunit ribosomal protein L18